MARTRIDPGPPAVVERQMRNWELARAQRRSAPRPKAQVVEDFVCLSRMAGVGDEVAALLGQRLGWPVFDKQILDVMAGDDRRMRQVYDAMDERDVGWWKDVLRPLVYEGVARNDYFHQLCTAVLALTRQSPGVFVGRGLDRVLPQELGLRVQLVAPLEVRVHRYGEEHGLDAETALQEIERIEAERAVFLRHHYGVEAGDPLRHDLTLRADRFPPDKAVELILDARACRRAGH